MWIFFLILLIVFEGLADVLSKEYSLRTGWVWFIGALAAYVIGNIFWLFSLRRGAGLARGAEIFSVATAIAALLIGLFYYHEVVHPREIAGMVLGIIALALIVW